MFQYDLFKHLDTLGKQLIFIYVNFPIDLSLLLTCYSAQHQDLLCYARFLFCTILPIFLVA